MGVLFSEQNAKSAAETAALLFYFRSKILSSVRYTVSATFV